MREPLSVTELLQYEFRQSLRFQVWQHTANPREGIAPADVRAAITQFEADLAGGVAVLAPCPLVDVLHRAEDISRRHTITGGYRGFDVLHVAAALVLKATEFLTFDERQRRLAVAEGLKVKP
jgi:predicted nucleic acid-binding protein